MHLRHSGVSWPAAALVQEPSQDPDDSALRRSVRKASGLRIAIPAQLPSESRSSSRLTTWDAEAATAQGRMMWTCYVAKSSERLSWNP